MSNTLVFYILLALFTVVVLIVLAGIRRRAAEARREQLKSAAQFLGWQFTPDVPMDWLQDVADYGLFNQGHSKKIRNVLSGDTQGVKTSLFDYEFVTGHGKHAQIRRQSVVYFHSQRLALPYFSLRPENVLHMIASVFGYQDIDLSNRPNFSGFYLLRGRDEAAIRRAFTDEIAALYENNSGTSTDGGGSRLFIFRPNFRIPPHEAAGFINWALAFYTLFARA